MNKPLIKSVMELNLGFDSDQYCWKAVHAAQSYIDMLLNIRHIRKHFKLKF